MGRGAKTGEEAADKYCFYIWGIHLAPAMPE
jgi:hypothetical protein